MYTTSEEFVLTSYARFPQGPAPALPPSLRLYANSSSFVPTSSEHQREESENSEGERESAREWIFRRSRYERREGVRASV